MPMSRPSITPPRWASAHSCWRRLSSLRTAGLAATVDTARGHLGAADLDGGVHPVDDHGVGHVQLELVGQAGHRSGVVRVDAPADGGKGHGPVHGAGVEIVQAEALGQGPGHG